MGDLVKLNPRHRGGTMKAYYPPPEKGKRTCVPVGGDILLKKIQDRLNRKGAARCDLVVLGGKTGFVDHTGRDCCWNIAKAEWLTQEEVRILKLLAEDGFVNPIPVNHNIHYFLP